MELIIAATVFVLVLLSNFLAFGAGMKREKQNAARRTVLALLVTDPEHFRDPVTFQACTKVLEKALEMPKHMQIQSFVIPQTDELH